MVKAFVLITAKTGKENDVMGYLKNIKGIKEVSIVYGDYDLVAKIEVESIEKLNEILLGEVRKSPDITVTTTLIGL